jgi:hypothetical protein
MQRRPILRLVTLAALLLALTPPASGAETWILWEKKEGQTSGEFNDTWTPVGSYESARGCRAMRREIVARYRRKDVTAAGADTVRVKDPLGWWLTYTCRPGGAPPR